MFSTVTVWVCEIWLHLTSSGETSSVHLVVSIMLQNTTQSLVYLSLVHTDRSVSPARPVRWRSCCCVSCPGTSAELYCDHSDEGQTPTTQQRSFIAKSVHLAAILTFTSAHRKKIQITITILASRLTDKIILFITSELQFCCLSL